MKAYSNIKFNWPNIKYEREWAHQVESLWMWIGSNYDNPDHEGHLKFACSNHALQSNVGIINTMQLCSLWWVVVGSLIYFRTNHQINCDYGRTMNLSYRLIGCAHMDNMILICMDLPWTTTRKRILWKLINWICTRLMKCGSRRNNPKGTLCPPTVQIGEAHLIRSFGRWDVSCVPLLISVILLLLCRSKWGERWNYIFQLNFKPGCTILYMIR